MLAMPPVQQIRPCGEADFDNLLAIVNDAAVAYRGKIPEDCWSEPYMPAEELAAEIKTGVNFSGFEEDGQLLGVMGLQEVEDVVLIRHAYTRTSHQGRGIGSQLLGSLLARAAVPVLVGTWADATWAIRFYQRHGFRLVVPTKEKDALLGRYWSIPPRQVETSVVLANERWWTERAP
jgi:GNAT superfamily N-acetyltransferase